MGILSKSLSFALEVANGIASVKFIFTNCLALFIMPPNAVLDEEKNKQAVPYLLIN